MPYPSREEAEKRLGRAERRLRELELAGEVVAKERSHVGPLPVIRLRKPTRLDRIIKLAKR